FLPRVLDYGRDFQLPVKPQRLGQPLSESSCVRCSSLPERKRRDELLRNEPLLLQS
ncbi:Uncharacterized protein DAT39_007901, partial [Clarias magur]